MTRRAFTITELLVVLALVAVLVSLIVPSAIRGVAVARRTICARNLSQLMTLIVAAQKTRRDDLGALPEETRLLRPSAWPAHAVQQEPNERVFLCPEDPGRLPGLPPIMYFSGISFQYVPFDPAHFSCCTRTGEDDKGPYTEYCIEENPLTESKWSHRGCCGWPQWSTNDGIWRVYDNTVRGVRELVLTHYHCTLPNRLWVAGKEYDNLSGRIGMSIYFTDIATSYGYNMWLDDGPELAGDTIVLADFDGEHIDPEDPEIIADLSDVETARHLGRINALTADGAVRPVSPPAIYPDFNLAPWTPAAD